ncbi:long-chain acyl-CoA synthetase [Acrocarpospora pleiomorpha]|uniref:Long-chain acyl-CoA synthetase n=2 Tax=Acrocarpospora pleiomorpha TaxID=90975 RepID=A0A5M3XCH0_9ACTN|nr:long-chain acyl-CoA synthetase [Acrocarpospora pleiomorpha]
MLTSDPDVVLSRFQTADGEVLETVPQLVRRNAAETPDRTAFRTMGEGGEWIGQPWREVYRAVAEFAAGLIDLEREHGQARPGQVGFVIGSNAPEFFVAEYALQASGVTAFPLFERMTAEEMRTTLASYPASVAFSGSGAATACLLDELDIRCVVQWGTDPVPGDPRVLTLAELRTRGAASLRRDPDAVDRRIDSGSLDDIACIILTSGTTGASKGVLGSYRYMLDVAARYAHTYGAKSHDRYLSFLPPAFSVEQYNGLTLAAALPLDVAFASSPAATAEEFVSSRSSMKFLGPRQWEELRATLPSELLHDPAAIEARQAEIRARLGIEHVTGCISAGGSLSAEVFDFFRRLGLRIRNLYGFAEVGIITTTRDCDPPESVGIPLPTAYGAEPIEVRLEGGEVQTRGGVRCADYWGETHQLALTADGWLRSGDAGVIDEGVLTVLDRLANIQRLPDGRTFAPQPIEINAMRSPFIANFLVIGGHGDDSRVAALVQLNESAVRRHLSAAALPEGFEALAGSAAVTRLMVEEVRKLNAEQPPSQRIDLIGLLPKPLSLDDGELTPSMKLRRAAVLRRYEPLVDMMFAGTDAQVSFTVSDRTYTSGIAQVQS